MAFADALDDAESIGHGDLRVEGPDVSCLDRGTIGNRIGEGNAELKTVCTGLDERLDDLFGGLYIRITEHDEGNEGTLLLLSKRGKEVFVAFHWLCLQLELGVFLQRVANVIDILIATTR